MSRAAEVAPEPRAQLLAWREYLAPSHGSQRMDRAWQIR